MTLGDDVDLEEFITAKDDLSGADIKAVCTEAGLLALRERRMRVNKTDFSAAREKVRRMGFSPSSLAHDSFRSYTGRMRASQRVYICNFPLSLHIIRLTLRIVEGRRSLQAYVTEAQGIMMVLMKSISTGVMVGNRV